MAQIFSPVADTVARVVLAGAAILPILFVSLAYALQVSPHVTDEAVMVHQPVPFSHNHHVAGLGLDCRYCHASVEVAFAGIPPTETCMTCHSQIWTNAALLAPVRQSFATNTPLHWQRVNRLPDYVYFDHATHVAKGVGCTSCHADIDKMPITWQSAPLTMEWCLDCHRDPAKNLRPREKIFSTDWQPGSDQMQKGHALLAEYGVKVDHLTDCSVCHR